MKKIPTNPTLMRQILEAIKTRDTYDRAASLQRQAETWFRTECLPAIIPTIEPNQWRKDKSAGWAVDNEDFSCRWLDHQVTFRSGRRRLSFVAVGMPYHIDLRRLRQNPAPVTLTKLVEHNGLYVARYPMEMNRLPDEWSWWYPGHTKIVIVAPAGLVELPQGWSDSTEAAETTLPPLSIKVPPYPHPKSR